MNEFTNQCYQRALKKAYKTAKRELEEHDFERIKHCSSTCYDFRVQKGIKASIYFEEQSYQTMVSKVDGPILADEYQKKAVQASSSESENSAILLYKSIFNLRNNADEIVKIFIKNVCLGQLHDRDKIIEKLADAQLHIAVIAHTLDLKLSDIMLCKQKQFDKKEGA